MTPKAKVLARIIAGALVSAPLEKKLILQRLDAILGKRYRWTAHLASRVAAEFGSSHRPLQRALASCIYQEQGFRRAVGRCDFNLNPALSSWAMLPARGAPATWAVPPITTVQELANLLNLSLTELRWFAGGWGCAEGREQRLQHYRYHWISKQDGTARLIEIPKQRLKAIQRFLLRHILAHIPPHEAAHGFRKARDIRTFACPHAGRALVLKLDLKDFFARLRKPRITAIFMTAGYPERVACALSGLCTNAVPVEILEQDPDTHKNPDRQYHSTQLYRAPHLPQGAPTSPALANLCAWRLDLRLAGLARAAGAIYTRYADDLLFSGGLDWARGVQRFYIKACAIALEEGFEVNTRKTRLMKPAVRQHAVGLTLNQHLNVSRQQYDQLKAILTNCVRLGPKSQNRANLSDFRAHLLGRIAHVRSVHPARGQKLAGLFEGIKWQA